MKSALIPGLLILAVLGACGAPVSPAEQPSAKSLIGAQPADSNQFPFITGLLACTAAKVSSHAFLTAAHCVVNHHSGWVFEGQGTLERGGIVGYVTMRAHPYPDYRELCAQGCSDFDQSFSREIPDIAIVEVEQTTIEIPELPIDTRPLMPTQRVVITGRGCRSLLEYVFGFKAPLLSFQATSIQSEDESGLYWRTPGVWEGGASGCRGDSGAPLLVYRDGQWQVAGVTVLATPLLRTLHTKLSDDSDFKVGTWLRQTVETIEQRY